MATFEDAAAHGPVVRRPPQPTPCYPTAPAIRSMRTVRCVRPASTIAAITDQRRVGFGLASAPRTPGVIRTH